MEAEIGVENKESVKEETTYFSVSPLKLMIMSVGTFGIYDLYWFYKNFCHIKQKNNLDIMPFWRAFFAPLWSYSAFEYIQDELKDKQISLKIYAGLLAVLYFIIQASWRLPDPFWIISTFSFVMIMPANLGTTRINEKVVHGFSQNSRIKGWNWLVILLGLPFFFLAVIGTFLPVDA